MRINSPGLSNGLLSILRSKANYEVAKNPFTSTLQEDPFTVSPRLGGSGTILIDDSEVTAALDAANQTALEFKIGPNNAEQSDNADNAQDASQADNRESNTISVKANELIQNLYDKPLADLIAEQENVINSTTFVAKCFFLSNVIKL